VKRLPALGEDGSVLGPRAALSRSLPAPLERHSVLGPRAALSRSLPAFWSANNWVQEHMAVLK
jgi:hypothetical protein